MLLNLVEEQMKLNMAPVIASIGERGIHEKPIEKEAIKKGVIVKKFRMIPGPNPAGTIDVLRYAKQGKYDLLHSHGYKGNILFGLMAKPFRNLPMISTLHGYTSTNGFSKMSVYEWLDRISLCFIDTVVLVNRGMLSNPKLKKLKNINFHVINNGISIIDPKANQHHNLTNQQFNDSQIVSFCSNGFIIGSIGRLSAEKAFDHLIEALRIIREKGVDARLVIIGEGGQREYLKDLISRNNINEYVLMPGYRDEAKQYIPYFNVYVISSLTEGLPITLLEAMHARAPIVSTSVGGIPEVLAWGKAGILVNPAEPKLLAKAAIQIHDNYKMIKNLTENAYQRLISHYSSSCMAKNYLKLYECILKNHNKHNA